MTTSRQDPPTFQWTVPGFGALLLRPLDPDGDAAVVHSWVDDERARFWGMVGHTREQVREVYAYLDSLTTHHAHLLLREGEPVALFQTYQPEHDPLGEHYPVQDGDFGVHLLIAPTTGEPRPGHTAVLIGALLAAVLTDRGVRRIVAEPDSRNEASIARLRRTGFQPGPEVQLEHKRARLLFLAREDAERFCAEVLPAAPVPS
ncbi:GNAT family N-acetyltransferase [Kitasatospora viridis]|uniref:Lysine N-acyltransferase MbtK n=1 Tax=Kitasatospora viridis TaxID=281105 RepID=A0A561TUY8_9ACTN|nr:GNAT family N-acetyltransferase [Kitasatospora viridis]TWF90914.1 RimJ/RimL family protein N-acetyltransferase [Kitasatospora viridis]